MTNQCWQHGPTTTIPNLILPAARITTWQPGVTYNGGIPTRNTIFQTLSPATTYAGIGTSGPTVTISIASPAVVTLASHGFTAGTTFYFETTGALPTGAATATLYYVLAAGLTTNTFEFSTSAGGAAVNTSGTQSGTQTIVLDDTRLIQAALTACPATKVVKLSTGVFRIGVPGLGLAAVGSLTVSNNITLRGSGPGNASLNTGRNGVANGRSVGTFVADPTATQLVKWDRANEFNSSIIAVGYPGETAYASHTALTADAIKGTNSCTLTSSAGLSAGQVVIIEMVGDFLNSPQNFTWSIGGGSVAVVNLANNFVAGQSVFFEASGGSLPAGITADIQQYGVSPVNLTTIAFQIRAAYLSVSPVTVVGSGSVTFFVNTGLSISAGQAVLAVDHSGTLTMTGTVSSYSGNNLVVTVSSSTGSGFSSQWNVLVGPDITITGTGTGTQMIGINTDHPDVYWGNASHSPPCTPSGSTRSFFHLQDSTFPYGARSFGQIMRIAPGGVNVDGHTVTFETVFGITFQTNRKAQLSVWGNATTFGIGIEDMWLFGGSNYNIFMDLSANCWVKNVDSMWCWGPAAGMLASYRCEIRDSFLHEMTNSNPGGAGYICEVSYACSDCLVENNIMWYGNKVIAMRSAGPGNVIAYNYTDDSMDADANPSAPEAGLNAGHNLATFMALIEGNYTHNYKGDNFWGASPYITVFRNHISCLRAAAAPLNTWVNSGGAHYGDLGGRLGVDLQAGSYKQNIVGNVIGYSTQHNIGTEVGFGYEQLSVFTDGTTTYMYNMGAFLDLVGNWHFDPTTYQTQLRQGNYDYVTNKQIWYANVGDTGTVSTGPAYSLPNSLYLPGVGPPAFWGANPWPWVDPSIGATRTLPAKARFQSITGLSPIPPGNQ